MKVAVVGGGLAGLAAALDLVDAGHAVTVYEARPTLGGAVQTLPEREGDPEPPPDNGQHIALGCFTEYLRFLDRVGEGGSYLRTRLALPVLDEDGSEAAIEPSLPALLRYSLLPLRDRLRLPVTTLRLRSRSRIRKRRSDSCSGDSGRRTNPSSASGTSSSGRHSTSRATRSTPWPGSSPSAPRCSARARTATWSCRRSRSAGCTATRPGVSSATASGSSRSVESLDELDADAIVVAVPPRESARLLGEEEPALEDSPIVSVHLWFDRPLLDRPLAALLGSDAHWVFDRGSLTGSRPERGQYLTVVSSGVPELLEVRGRELVERIAAQLTERLGEAELLWSRVSREPYATIALRPGVERPGVETSRPNVARAGTWTDTGWPATMESAIRSGRRAAQHILSSTSARVTA